jgi:methionyl aminopeptidase
MVITLTHLLLAIPVRPLRSIRVTKESLYKGIEKAVAGNRVGDISFAIQEHTGKYGYGVRELVGHGLGNMHEDRRSQLWKRGSGIITRRSDPCDRTDDQPG